MPENDLGTAHGQIEISFDNKGIRDATAALKKFDAEAKAMQKSMDRITKSANDFDKIFSSSSKSFREASKYSSDYSSSLSKSEHHTERLRQSTRRLIDELKDLKRALQDVNNEEVRSSSNHSARGRGRRDVGGAGSGASGGGGGGALIGGGVAAGYAAKQAAKNLELQTQSLKRMEKQFDKMNLSIESVNKTLKINNVREIQSAKATKDVAKNTKDAEAAARGYSNSMFDTHKRIRAVRSDTINLKDDIQDLMVVMSRVQNVANKGIGAFNFFSGLGEFDRNDSRGIIREMTIASSNILKSRNELAKSFAGWQAEILFGRPAQLMDWGKFKLSRGNRPRSMITKADRPENYIRNFGRGIAPGFQAASVLGIIGAKSAKDRLTGVRTSMDEAPLLIRRISALSKATVLLGGAGLFANKGFGLLYKTLGNFQGSENIGKFAKKLHGQFELIDRTLRRISAMSQRKLNFDITGGLGGKTALGTVLPKTIERNIKNFLLRNRAYARIIKNSNDRILTDFKRFGKDLGSVTLGVATTLSGFKSLWGHFQWFFKIPKPIMATMMVFASSILPTALKTFSSALKGTSNLIVGIVGAVKQLSGGLMAIPGIIGMFGATITGFMGVFVGLKDQMKDIFDLDPTKATEAFDKLPEHLKPIGKALQGVVADLRGMQTLLQKQFFRGVENQIRDMGKIYVPLMGRSIGNVVSSLSVAKNHLFDFFMAQRTQGDVGKLYGNTAQGILAISRAIKPALSGLSDMAVVGSGFIAHLDSWTGVWAASFQKWASVNRENGNMARGMRDAAEATVDLVIGLKNASVGLYGLLTLFKTTKSMNPMKDFADGMQKFSKWVSNSKATGGLAKLKNTLSDMGGDKIQAAKDIFNSIKTAVQKATPFIKNFSDAFTKMFSGQLQFAVDSIGSIVKVLNDVGATKTIGLLAGWGIGIKILPKVQAAALALGRTMFGTFLILRDGGKVIQYVESAFLKLGYGIGRLGGPFDKFGQGIMNFGSKGSKLVSTILSIARVASIAVPAVLLLYSAFKSYRGMFDNFNKNMAESKQGIADFGNNLRKAFMQDRGLVGSNVMTSVSDAMTEMMQNLKQTADGAPGFWSHVQDKFFKKGSVFSNIGKIFTGKISEVDFRTSGGLFSDSDELNKLQDDIGKAQNAFNKLKEMQNNGVDLSKIVTGSDAYFKTEIDKLRQAGGAWGDAADELQKHRDKFNEINAHMQTLTPAGVDFAAGLDKLAEAAGNAESKLNGLQTVLEALGYLQINSMQATAQYYESLQNLSTGISQALGDSKDPGAAWDAQAKSLNLMSDAGQKALSVFAEFSQNFHTLAANGGDVSKMYADMQAQVDETVAALQNAGNAISKEDLLGFLQNKAGIAPQVIDLSLQIGDGSAEAKQLKATILALQAAADHNSLTLPINFDNDKAANAFNDTLKNSILGGASPFIVKDGTLQLPAGTDPRSIMPMLMGAAAQRGFKFDAQGGQKIIPGLPIPNRGAMGDPLNSFIDQLTRGGQAGQYNPGFQNPYAPTQPKQQFQPGFYLPAPTAPASGTAPKMPVPVAPAEAPAQTPKMPSSVAAENIAPQAEAQTSGLEKVKGAIDSAKEKWGEYPEAVGAGMEKANGSIQNSSDAAVQILNNAASGARAAGTKFVEEYAAGLESQSAVAKAAGAAASLAATIKSFFHASPPKTGPLSQHGDAALYGGQVFTKTYAKGIAQYSRLVGNAAASVAGSAQFGLGTAGGGQSGYFGLTSGGLSGGMDQILNQSQRIVQFLSDFTGVVQQFGQSFFQALKLISDPMGKGEFFGKKVVGFRRDPNVTDKMLADRRADEAYAQTHDGNVPNDVAKEQKAAAKGRPLSANQTISANNPSQRQIAQTIYNRAIDQGYSNQDALAIVAASHGTSGLSTAKGLFGSSTPGLSGGQAVDEQVTQFLQQMYQAQAGNIYARIREVGRQNGADFTNIRSNEPDSRILVAPGDTDTGVTTTTKGTKGGRRRTNVGQTDALGNVITSGEPGQVADVQILGGNLDISEDLHNAIQTGINPLSGDKDIISSLTKIQNAIDQQTALDTPASRATAAGLESAKGQIMSSRGYAEEENPIDKMQNAFTSAGNVVQNVFGAIQSGLNAIGGAKIIGDQLVRGMSSTDDIVNMVTQVQKFIDFGAKIASTVSSIADLAGQAASSTQFGAPAQAVSAVGQIISGAMQGVNAAIDLGKEAWEIFGSYFGQFLGSLAGGQNQLQGNVRFLLDAKAGQLLAYSADNPNNKTAHSIPGLAPSLGPNGGNTIGQINMYSGPGSDPRDDTRNMLYQVQAAQLQGAIRS